MSATHVIDASAALKIVLDEPEAPEFRRWFSAQLHDDARFLAPSVFPYEVANALWHRVPAHARHGPQWTRDIVRDILIVIELDEDAWARIDPWREILSAYDAAYLSLADGVGASLVTYDKKLADAASRRVNVVTPT